MKTVTKQAAVALVALLALTSFCSLEGKPVKTSASEEEVVEVRGMVFDPTAETEFQVRVGDITYFTESYLDILNDKPEYKAPSSVHGKEKRAAQRDRRWLWPGGRIHYKFSDYYYESEKSVLLRAMAHWEDNTCIRFFERTTERDYLYIYPGPGCSSYVGQTLYEQRVSIGPSCFSFEAALHELGHAIGFYHEQSRPDRDEHVNIIYDNIKSGAQDQFERIGENVVDSLGVGYDYNSIMHYDPYAFAIDRTKETIIALDPTIPVGRQRVLSQLDILQTNMLYKCSNSTKDHPPRTTLITSGFTIAVLEPMPTPAFPCGGVFDGKMSGSFSSPGYSESVYSNNMDCEWRIRVPEGYQIKITVDLAMDYSPGCDKDFVEVHEQLDRSGYRLGRWCYIDTQISPYTNKNNLNIRFHTDESKRRSTSRGFQLSYEAVDINECELGYCSHNCKNLPRSFECSCPKGFYLSTDGRQCFDTNECALGKGGCDHKCVNRGGSFHCECDPGYTLLSDGKTCDKTGSEDPCLTADCEHGCVIKSDRTARCLCPKGYIISSDGKTCTDHDECSTNNGGCEALCTNSEGSYECSCHHGYTLSNDLLSCEDVNECNSNNGGCDQGCLNTIGLFQCTCDEGHELQDDGFTCAPSSTFTIFEASRGEIHSPNWPETYPIDVDLRWIIRCPQPDQTIKFSLNHSPFSIGGQQIRGCPKDWVKVYAGETESDILYGPYCHKTPPNDFKVSSSNAMVVFHSGPKHHVSRKGFKLSYVCVDSPTKSPPTTMATTTQATTQMQTTMPLTTNPPTTMAMTTQATTQAQTTLPLTTTIMDKITDISTDIPPTSKRTCFSEQLPTNPKGRFSCGGFLQPGVKFGSPGFPGFIPNGTPSKCMYTTIGRAGHSHKFLLHHLNLSSSKDCAGNSLKIYTGFGENKANLVETLCGCTEPGHAVTINNFIITIVLETSQTSTARGFWGTVEEV